MEVNLLRESDKNSQYFSSRNSTLTTNDSYTDQSNSTKGYQYNYKSSTVQVLLAQYMSRQAKDKNIPSNHIPPGNSMEQFEHPGHAKVILTSGTSYHRPQNMTFNQPRPPSSSGSSASSGRPTSASFKPPPTRRQHSRQEVANAPSEDLRESPAVRPPSSLSKYQLLPAIGSPVPVEKIDNASTNHLHNIIKKSPAKQQQSDTPQLSQPNKKSAGRVKDTSKISLKDSGIFVGLDTSVLPNKTLTYFKKPTEMNSSVMSIEKLDLSQTERPESGLKRKTTYNNLTHTKSKESLHRNNIKTNPSDLYDGDDDDSDSKMSPLSKHDDGIYNRPKSTTKRPVVIPSPDNPPAKEILLAVKLPTDGTRHQKYFNINETLQSIVEFAEQIAGLRFNGYILVVASAPKTVFVDLEDTIENAGLEDKTVFHLEEYDWDD